MLVRKIAAWKLYKGESDRSSKTYHAQNKVVRSKHILVELAGIRVRNRHSKKHQNPSYGHEQEIAFDERVSIAKP
jgi:hypothetical protein